MTINFRKVCSLFLSHRRNITVFRCSSFNMGSIVSCGKSGTVNITGNETEAKSMATKSNNENIVEGIVCSESDVPEEGVKAFTLNDNKILLAKTKGIIYAVGASCSHYGLPLEKGSLSNGRIRCPFHGACFSLKTGDIEDFPGLDSIPKFETEIVNGQVKVTARQSCLENKRRAKTMTKRDPANNETFIVVGGGAASSKCVETLRQEGFSGRLLLLSSEQALPYDRPKLSKAMDLSQEALALRTSSFYEEADIELCLGATVTAVDTSAKQVSTAAGKTFAFDKLFIATGGRPRALSVPGGDLSGVFVLRSPSDANDIVRHAKGKKVAVIGSSFIGMEAAAYLSCEDRCASVTVLGSSSVPFERSLGSAVGDKMRRWFEEKGVAFRNSAKVTRIQGDGAVEKVIYDDDQSLEADVVLAGIGVLPSTEFLAGSGVELDERGYVIVNEEMETSAAGVFCGGDIAAFPLFLRPDAPRVAIGHWQMAHAHGHAAARNMVGGKTPLRSVPFFWTVLFGHSLRYAGYGAFDDVILSGDLEALSFIAYYCQGDAVVGVASLGKDPAAANYANYILGGAVLTKAEVVANPDIAMSLR